jgi:hypothetical protein
MCSSCPIILVLAFTLTASAQHRGGIGGGPPNQSGAFPPRVGAPFGGKQGNHPSWQTGVRPSPCPFLSQACHSAPPFSRAGIFRAPYPRVVVWNGWPAFGGYGFESIEPGYPVEPYMPEDYPQAFNVPAAPPMPIEAPRAMADEMVPQPVEQSAADTSEMPVYRGPESVRDTSDDHPPLIALKNHWAYTALKYWVKGKTFHFITTQGDHMQVPVGLVERIYPTPHGDKTETKKPPAH